MPPRQRHGKRHRRDLSLREMMALRVGPRSGADDDLTDDVLQGLYLANRERLLEDCGGGRAPWCYWAYEPGIPARLRATRVVLTPVADDEPVPADRHAETQAIVARRAAFLAEHADA
jgi:hypothetical protein